MCRLNRDEMTCPRETSCRECVDYVPDEDGFDWLPTIIMAVMTVAIWVVVGMDL